MDTVNIYSFNEYGAFIIYWRISRESGDVHLCLAQVGAKVLSTVRILRTQRETPN